MGNACLCGAGGPAGIPGASSSSPPPSAAARKQSKDEFRLADTDGDGKISRSELSDYIARRSELWAMLGVNLNLEEGRCRAIAAEVAFDLATTRSGGGGKKSTDADEEASIAAGGEERSRESLTESQFRTFHERYVLNPHGSREFFGRAVFAAFDANGNGVLEPSELDRFLDTFYSAGSIFEGDERLPPKSELRRMVHERMDDNGDGVLSFEEIRTLIGGTTSLENLGVVG